MKITITTEHALEHLEKRNRTNGWVWFIIGMLVLSTLTLLPSVGPDVVLQAKDIEQGATYTRDTGFGERAFFIWMGRIMIATIGLGLTGASICSIICPKSEAVADLLKMTDTKVEEDP